MQLKLFVRNRQRVKHLKNYDNVEYCDLALEYTDANLLSNKLQGIHTVYYLIHSMDEQNKDDFQQTDLMIAKLVSGAAYKANVNQIIYLGGLGVQSDKHPLSIHLQNRHQVGNVLRQSGTPVTEIRAGIIIGAGSASFEIIRALGVKLPFIPKLNYKQGLCNPVDVDDVIQYLIQAHKNKAYLNQIVEIGMLESYRYDEIIYTYANIVLNRKIKKLNIGFLNIFLSKKVISRIVSYLSAIPYALSKPLIDGFDSMAIKGKYKIENIDKSIIPINLETSILKASEDEQSGRVESFWSIPLSLQVLSKEKEKFIHIGSKDIDDDDYYKELGLLYEIRERSIDIEDIDKIFNEVKKVGGKHGYWSPSWMWKIRAFVDKVVGGPGLEVGRRTDTSNIRIGERFDFWIVSAYLDTPSRKIITLKGRIKSPGDSWLQFALFEDEEGWKFTVRAYFNPSGFFGYVYWYSLYFVHKYIFDIMIDNIIRESKKL